MSNDEVSMFCKDCGHVTLEKICLNCKNKSGGENEVQILQKRIGRVRCLPELLGGHKP